MTADPTPPRSITADPNSLRRMTREQRNEVIDDVSELFVLESQLAFMPERLAGDLQVLRADMVAANRADGTGAGHMPQHPAPPRAGGPDLKHDS
jgi:hypothetical protein